MKSLSTFQLILLVIFGFLAVIAVLMFAGIIPGASGLAGGTVAGQVVMWGPYGGDELNQYFGDLNNIKTKTVQIKYEPQAPETYLDKLIEAFARGGGPDLFLVDQNMLNRLAGKTTDISYLTYSERDFLNNFVDGAEIFSATSSWRALPLLIDPLVMYYNRTLYTSAGIVSPPTSWEQFVATLKPLNRPAGQGDFTQTAVAAGEFRNVTNANYLLSALVFQAGNLLTVRDGWGNYRFDLANNYGFTPSPAEAALNFYLQFSNPSSPNYSWNRSLDLDKDMFVAEKLATYFGFASELADLQAKNPHLNFDAVVIPQKDPVRRLTYGRFLGAAIAGNSQQKGLAYTAALLLTQPENLKQLAKILALSPARRDLLAKPAGDPWQQTFNDSAVIARSFVDPDRIKTRALLGQMVEDVQTGRVTASQAISDTNGRINLLFSNE